MRIWNVNDKVKIKLEQEIKEDLKRLNKYENSLNKNIEIIKSTKKNIIRLQTAIKIGIFASGSKNEGLYFMN